MTEDQRTQLPPQYAPGEVEARRYDEWVAAGLFGYDRRGILDETHLRFFTRATLRRLVRASGFDILEEHATGLPLRAISETDGRKLRIARKSDRVLVGIRPTLFGYQYVLRLTPHAQGTVHVEVI